MRIELMPAAQPLEVEVGGRVISCTLDCSDEVVAWVGKKFKGDELEITALQNDMEGRDERPEDAEKVVEVMMPTISRMMGEEAAGAVLEAVGGPSKGLTQLFRLWLELNSLAAKRMESTREERLAKYLDAEA